MASTTNSGVDLRRDDCPDAVPVVVGGGCGGADEVKVAKPKCGSETATTAATGDTGLEPVVEGGGCGCSSAGGSASLALVLALWALCRRMSFVVVLLVLPLGPAWAQDAQRALIDGGNWVLLRESRLDEAWTPALTLSMNYANELVTLVGPRRSVGLLRQVTTRELAVSMQFGRVVRLGVSAPQHFGVLAQDVQIAPFWGDVSFWAMLPLSNQDGEGLEAAWIVQFDRGGPGSPYFLGDPGALQGMVVASGDLPAGRLTGELGFRLHEPVELPGGTWADSLQWGVGWRYAELGPLALGGEFAGRLPMRLKALRPPEAPAEAAFVAALRLGPWVTVQGAVGAGLNRGLGTPASRAIGAVDLRARTGSDVDEDGIPDHRDLCRRQPEDPDGYQDWDGCPDTDNDSDGFLDPDDVCPDVAEVINGIDDDDGCPESVTLLVVVVETRGEVERAELRIGAASMEVFAGEAVSMSLTAPEVIVEAAAVGHRTETLSVALGQKERVNQRIQLELVPVGSLSLTAEHNGVPTEVLWTVVAEDQEAQIVLAPDGSLSVPAGLTELSVSAPGFLPQEATVVIEAGGDTRWEVQLSSTGIRLEGDSVQVGDRVFFALDEDVIRDETGLDELLAWLQAHPEALLVRIEGHADAVGRSRYNYDLSVRRAEAVMTWLVAEGIAPERLQAIGTGEAGTSAAGLENRRVGFTVLVWAD